MCTYEWLCRATVSGVPEFQQQRLGNSSTCRRSVWAFCRTVTAPSDLQEAKSLSGCSFNEGMGEQFASINKQKLTKIQIFECIY